MSRLLDQSAGNAGVQYRLEYEDGQYCICWNRPTYGRSHAGQEDSCPNITWYMRAAARTAGGGYALVGRVSLHLP
jgi:hypothetical protein